MINIKKPILKRVYFLKEESKVDIKRLSDAFERLSRIERKKQPIFGIKQSDIRVLLCIKDISGKPDSAVTVSEISKRIVVTSPTVTELVKCLSKEGSLERSINSTDKRVVDLKLTDKGEHILKKIKSHYSILFAGLL